MPKKISLVKTPEQLRARKALLEQKRANAAKPLKIHMKFGDALKKVVKFKAK
jgi:hypothetical protein